MFMFLFHKLWYIDYDLYYEVIQFICLYFLFCENKKFIWFTCIFHTSVYGLFSLSKIYKLIYSELLSTFAIDR